jgi:hypothetical protein
MGVVSALLRFCHIDLMMETWNQHPLNQVLSLVVYALLILYFIKMILRKAPTDLSQS